MFVKLLYIPRLILQTLLPLPHRHEQHFLSNSFVLRIYFPRSTPNWLQDFRCFFLNPFLKIMCHYTVSVCE